ncbi:MAG: hypothetical protein ACPF9D_12365, partial [Owenweeksia sp.]
MKIHKPLISLLFLPVLFACQQQSVPDSTSEKLTKTDTTQEDSTSATVKKPHTQKKHEYYFISARSGINYRQSPEGKVLGKLPL